MSGGDDWQPGDLALCVRPCGTPTVLFAGGVYTVSRLWLSARNRAPVLSFVGVREPRAAGAGWRIAHFRKIKPLTDEEREEALREMNPPAREIVQ